MNKAVDPKERLDVQAILGMDTSSATSWMQRRELKWATLGLVGILLAAFVWWLEQQREQHPLYHRAGDPRQADGRRHRDRLGAADQPGRDSSELSGTVRKVLVDYNRWSRPGDVLAELDTDKLKATVTARAPSSSLPRRRCRKRGDGGGEATATRAQGLAATQAISEQDLDQAQAAYDRAVAHCERPRRRRRRRGRPEAQRNQSRQGLDQLADRRRRADAQRRSGPDRRFLAAGAGAVLDRGGPEEDGAAGRRRRSRRRQGPGRPARHLHASTPIRTGSSRPTFATCASPPRRPGRRDLQGRARHRQFRAVAAARHDGDSRDQGAANSRTHCWSRTPACASRRRRPTDERSEASSAECCRARRSAAEPREDADGTPTHGLGAAATASRRRCKVEIGATDGRHPEVTSGELKAGDRRDRRPDRRARVTRRGAR